MNASMYQIYETPAFIFKNEISKEYNQKTLAFTELFGLISFHSSSSKKQSSKLKSAITTFSYSKLALVKGKNTFRLTGGFLLENICLEKGEFKEEKIKTLSNLFSFLNKYFVKNQPGEDTFLLLKQLYFALLSSENLKQIKINELVFLTNFLHNEGYFDLSAHKIKALSFDNFAYHEKKEFDLKKIREKVNESLKSFVF